MDTAKVSNIIEAGATCKRNMFYEFKIAIKCNIKITYRVWWCDAMTKDVRREEMSMFGALSGWTNNDEIGFVGIELKGELCSIFLHYIVNH